MIVTHENFNECLNQVKENKAIFYVQSCTKIIKIDYKIIRKFEKMGYTVISIDSKADGFRMQSGKSKIYILPNQLIIKEI